MEGLRTVHSIDDASDDDTDGATDDDNATDDDTDDEYDAKMYDMQQALPIPDGEPDWEAGEPDTVEEYLKRVRWEAARVPEVLTAAIDASTYASHQTNYMPEVEAMPDPPAWALCDTTWVRRFVLEFQLLRQFLAQAPESDYHELATASLPHLNDHKGWDCLCFGKDTGEGAVQVADGQEPSTPAADDAFAVPGPMMHIITRMDQVAVVPLLLRHVEQLEDTPLSLLRSQWLFALTAKLDKPIPAETAAALRQLLRRCYHLRAGLQQHDDPLLPLLNILIAISGAYFGQDETFTGLIECDLY